MATQPINTAKLYALTAAGACSVTLTQGEKSITWEALAEGGQTSFVVPAGATVSISDEAALLSPLPENFKAALGAGVSSAGGERYLDVTHGENEGEYIATMAHGSWCRLPENTTALTLRSDSSARVLSMTLCITPAINMPEGWLQTPEGIVLKWLFVGEPLMPGGNNTTYLIGLTQVNPTLILANLLATY